MTDIPLIKDAFDFMAVLFGELATFIANNDVVGFIIWVEVIGIGISIFVFILGLFKRRRSRKDDED